VPAVWASELTVLAGTGHDAQTGGEQEMPIWFQEVASSVPARQIEETRYAIATVACPEQGCKAPQGTPYRTLDGGEKNRSKNNYAHKARRVAAGRSWLPCLPGRFRRDRSCRRQSTSVVSVPRQACFSHQMQPGSRTRKDDALR
jgi:hypothetical protein